MNTQSTTNSRLRPAYVTQRKCCRFNVCVCVEPFARAILDFVVLYALHYYEVVRVVILAITVDVMNNLISGKWTPDHVLSYQPMLVIAPPVFIGDAVSATSNMPTFVVPVLGTVLVATPAYLAAADRALTKLFKSYGAKSRVPKRPVFLCSHVVGYTKVRGRYLHRTFQPTQFALDPIVAHCNALPR